MAPRKIALLTDSCADLSARVAEEKANPRCLKHLWQTTRDGFRAQLDRMVEQACDSLLEAEQLALARDSREVEGP